MSLRSLDDLAVEFQIGLFETAVGLGRDDLALLAELAELYTRAGEYEKGLDLDHVLVNREPANPIFRYNLACSLSLLGHLDDAFSALGESLDHGFGDIKLLLEDRDLENLRPDARWTALVSRLAQD